MEYDLPRVYEYQVKDINTGELLEVFSSEDEAKLFITNHADGEMLSITEQEEEGYHDMRDASDE